MICLACRELSPAIVCAACSASLRPVADRVVEPGVLVRSAFLHEGPGRDLVHRLKYDGIVATAAVLAPALAPLVSGANVLVPVPRTVVRRHRFGIDPALELARSVSRLTGTPVMAALGPPLGGRSRAGRARSERRPLRLTVRSPVPSGAVLIDDVVTTGSTIGTVAAMLGASAAVTATSRILGSSWEGHRPKTLSD